MPKTTHIEICEALILKIREALIHGSTRFRAARTYREVKYLIRALAEKCETDLSMYFMASVDQVFSKVSTDITLARCRQLVEDTDTSDLTRVYSLSLIARLELQEVSLETNMSTRQMGIEIARKREWRVLEALMLTNAVLPLLYKSTATAAEMKLMEARFALSRLNERQLKTDPDAFGLHARIKAHDAKILVHKALESGLVDDSTVKIAVQNYDEVCEEVEEYDHLRANYETELADELHKIARAGIDSALGAAGRALETAGAGADAHFCDLCRGYYHQIYADHHILVGRRSSMLNRRGGLISYREAKKEAGESLRFYGLTKHPYSKYPLRIIGIAEEETTKLEKPTKVFLSHKGSDKNLVRRFRDALLALNYSPWLDEDALRAGVSLDRGILKGMKESCAAVFFITPSFVDQSYISTEIEYAVSEKRSRGDDFAIITLVFADSNGRRGIVPDLLKRFVWKEPFSDLEAFSEITRSLPLSLPHPRWV